MIEAAHPSTMLRSPWVRRYSVVLLAAAFMSEAGTAASSGYPKQEAPIPPATVALMAEKNTWPAAPILMRVYKKEAELEVWKRSSGGRFVRLKTFPICRWSGQLGPKRREGDRQAPEGFYAITPAQMNPNSAHYLSFDTGFPNAFDRAQGSTGSALMVHGTCSSAGCYAMTNEGISEIYALAREAFSGGQKAIQFQAFPFRMTAENLVRHRSDPHIAFWRQLKEGSDRFEATGVEPLVSVAAGRYAFRPAKDPEVESTVLSYRAQEEDHEAVLLEEGRPVIHTTYVDGGQHPSFIALSRRGVSLGEVSRPEALAYAGREIVLAPARPMRVACPDQGPVGCSTRQEEATGSVPGALRTGAFGREAGTPRPSLGTEDRNLTFRPGLLGFAEPHGGMSPFAGSYPVLPSRFVAGERS